MDTAPRRWPYAIAIAVLAVYALLASCAYPALDDWVFACNGRDSGVFAATGSYLHSWGGRWASAVVLYGLGALPDLVGCYPILVLGGLALAGWALQRSWGWRGACLAGAPLLAWLPSTAEGPYWLSGGVTYLLPGVLLGLAAGLPQSRGAAAGRILLGACAAGCSETALVLGAAACAAACLIHGRRHAWTLAGLAAGGLVAVLAPGNAARWDVVAGGPHPHLLAACLASLPQTFTDLGGLLGAAWLCPLAPALAAAIPNAAPESRWHRRTAPVVAITATVGGAFLALLACDATIGFIEGRHANALWLHLTLGAAAAAWMLGLHLGSERWRACLLAWWTLCWIHLSLQPAAGPATLLLAAAAVVAAAWLAWRSWRSGSIDAPAWLALVALAAPGFAIACTDLRHAPLRRAEQWRRDHAVAAMQAAGVQAVRIPLLHPDHRPATISVGDLQTGHWATMGYATWHHLAHVTVDPRIPSALPDTAR